ncbi:MAG: hypothetical protein U9O94_01040 [Nanoarchaeota archaeon]|nr:hypothetical protein [Nanoarchaeota archaeon]
MSRNKGFVFTLDATLAVVILIPLLAFSAFYITKAGGESVSKLQTIRIGGDVLAVLDYDGTLDTLSVESIEIGLNRILPINYHMRINVKCENQGPIIVETTDVFPKNRFIGAGKRVFIANTDEYCVADFRIWLK